MKAMPKLTVCVPSRNRQRYFQETIRSLIINLRMDVEFVFADNSDDPDIMRDFMKDCDGDPRIVFLPSQEHPLSMIDNWERCMERATGDFVTFIGDDDFIEIDVIDQIAAAESASAPKRLDGFLWSKIYYNWPDARWNPTNVEIHLGADVFPFPIQAARDVFFNWTTLRSSPNIAFSIYHNAISRAMMDEIRQTYAGRYFEHPVVDFDNACKFLTKAQTAFFSERPFSIYGSCAKSNSGRGYTSAQVSEQHSQFMKETGRNIDDDPHMADFPFPSIIGMSACVGLVQQWFLRRYDLPDYEGWEINFTKACANNCVTMAERMSYDAMVEGYRHALKRWQKGRYLKYFNPHPFVDKRQFSFATGIVGNRLYVAEDAAMTQTPAEFYAFANQLLVPVQDLVITWNKQSYAA